MSPTTPVIDTDLLRTCPPMQHVTQVRGMPVAFQWMASKFQMCMQAMAPCMQASPPASSTPPQAATSATAGIYTAIAFALIRPSRRGLKISKGDFYFMKGR